MDNWGFGEAKVEQRKRRSRAIFVEKEIELNQSSVAAT